MTLPSGWIWMWKPIPTLQYSLPVLRPDTCPSSTSWCSKYARSDPVSTAERGNWKRSKSRRGTFILSRELSVSVLGHFQHFAAVPAIWGNSLFHWWALPSAAGAEADLLARRYLYHKWSHCLMRAWDVQDALSHPQFISDETFKPPWDLYIVGDVAPNSASLTKERNVQLFIYTLIHGSVTINDVRGDQTETYCMLGI